MSTHTFDSIASKSAANFDRMMRETHRRAYHLAYQLTGSSTEAEDLVQETYVKAWKAFPSFDTSRSFLNWILRILQRANLDRRRRDNPVRKAEPLSLVISPSDGEVQEIEIADSSIRADELALRAEAHEEILAAIRQLPEVYGEALILCDLEDYSYQEIAEVQNTTVGTIRSRIHRGRALLRDVMRAKIAC